MMNAKSLNIIINNIDYIDDGWQIDKIVQWFFFTVGGGNKKQITLNIKLNVCFIRIGNWWRQRKNPKKPKKTISSGSFFDIEGL